MRDIADVAVAALTQDRHFGRTYTLTGPEALTHADMAVALSHATGRPITFDDVSPEDFEQVITGLLPPWQVAGLLEDYAHYSRGEAAEVTSDVEDVTGHEPRPFARCGFDHAVIFSTPPVPW